MDWHPIRSSKSSKSQLRWTVAGALCLALTLGVLARRQAARAPVSAPQAEEYRDAVASPLAPAALGAVRGAAVAPAPGYFAGAAGRRAQAERTLVESRRRNAERRPRARR